MAWAIATIFAVSCTPPDPMQPINAKAEKAIREEVGENVLGPRGEVYSMTRWRDEELKVTCYIVSSDFVGNGISRGVAMHCVQDSRPVVVRARVSENIVGGAVTVVSEEK